MKWFKDITTDNQNDFDLVSICGVIAFAGLMFFNGGAIQIVLGIIALGIEGWLIWWCRCR